MEDIETARRILRDEAIRAQTPLDLEANFNGHIGVGGNLTDRGFKKQRENIQKAIENAIERLKEQGIGYKPYAGRVHADYNNGLDTRYWTEVRTVSGEYTEI